MNPPNGRGQHQQLPAPPGRQPEARHDHEAPAADQVPRSGRRNSSRDRPRLHAEQRSQDAAAAVRAVAKAAHKKQRCIADLLAEGLAWRDATAPQTAPDVAGGDSDGDDDSHGSLPLAGSPPDEEGKRQPDYRDEELFERKLLRLLPLEQPLPVEVALNLPTRRIGDPPEDEEAEQQELIGCLAGYAKYQHVAAKEVSELAKAAFLAVAAGEAELPRLPSNLAPENPPGQQGARRTLQYAAKLRSRGASPETVATHAQQYAEHAQRLCLCFEHICLGAPDPLSAPAAKAGSKRKATTAAGAAAKPAGRPTGAEAHAYLLQYLRLLHELFPELLPPPLEMPAGLLEAPDDSFRGRMTRMLRALCKVFIVWRQEDAWQEGLAAASALLAAGDTIHLPYEPEAMRVVRRRQQAAASAAAEAEASKATAATAQAASEAAQARAAAAAATAQAAQTAAASARYQAASERQRSELRRVSSCAHEATALAEAAAAEAAAAAAAAEAAAAEAAAAAERATEAARVADTPYELQPGQGIEARVDKLGRPAVVVLDADDSVYRRVGCEWDKALAAINDHVQDILRGQPSLKYGDVSFDGSLAGKKLSCDMMTSSMVGGFMDKTRLHTSRVVVKAIKESADPTGRTSNLYLTDASCPESQPGIPDDAPGITCAIDRMMNPALPNSVKTQRGTNGHLLMKNESTGVASVSGYAMFGVCCFGTAVHQETLLLPSLNVGSGDFVIQAETSIENIRLLQRVQAAVVGCFERHMSLLPPHMYLLNGVKLVLYLRDQGFATMVEFCQASCHSVITFGSQQAFPPTTKAAYNDLDIRRDVTPAVYSELLANAYTAHIPPEGHPADNANSWLQSAQLRSLPCTLSERQAMKAAGKVPAWREEWDYGERYDSDEEAGQQYDRRYKGRHYNSRRPITPDLPEQEPQDCVAADPAPSSRRGSRLHSTTPATEEQQQEGASGSTSRVAAAGHAGGKGRGGSSKAEEEEEEEEETATMILFAVRLVEKVLDILGFRIVNGTSYSRELPSRRHCLRALCDLLPVLRYLHKKAESELPGEGGRAFLERVAQQQPHPVPFSKEYLERLIAKVESVGPYGLQKQLRRKRGRFAGAPLEGLPPSSGGTPKTRKRYVRRAVRASWVLDAYLRASCALAKQIAEAAKQMRDEDLLALGANVVRGHWLLACHRELEVLTRANINWEEVARRRKRRAHLELLCGRASNMLAAQVLQQMRRENPAAWATTQRP